MRVGESLSAHKIGSWLRRLFGTSRPRDRRRDPRRFALEELESRLTPSFDLTINLGVLPDADNPYGSVAPALKELDDKVFASAWGKVDGVNSQLSWTNDGTLSIHNGPLPSGPSVAASGTMGDDFFTLTNLADASKVKVGMSAFTSVGGVAANSLVTAVDAGTGKVTLNKNIAVTFTDTVFLDVAYTATGTAGNNFFMLSPADAANVKVGMRAFGGIAGGGNAMPNFAIVVAVDAATGKVTLNGNLLVDANDKVVFSNTLPDQQIMGNGLTLHLPTDQRLESVRIVFTIGGHGWFPVLNNGDVSPPTVFSDPYYQLITFDFVEFTLDISGTQASKFTFNQSMIDQFGIPLQIAVSPGITGQPDQAGVLPSFTRDEIIAEWDTFIAAQNAGAQSVFGDLTNVPNQEHRIVSPRDRIALPSLPADTKTYFDSQIVGFFNKYASETFTMYNVAGGDGTGKANSNLHDLQGRVVTLNQAGVAATTTPGGGNNEVQTLTLATPDPTKAFVLTYNGTTTNALAVTATAADVQVQLDVLLGAGNSVVTGTPGNYTVTFQGALANMDVAQIDFVTSTQRVLQLTDITTGVPGNGDVFFVYEPFWQTNGYATKPTGYPSANVPATAPFWIVNAGQSTESPGQMVFGGDGVFADNLIQPGLTGDQRVLIAAIENVIVTAFNRGVALNPYSDWLYSSRFINTPAGGGVTVSGNTMTLPAFLTQIVPGIGVKSGDFTAIVDSVSADGKTVTLRSGSTIPDGSYDNIIFTYSFLENPFFKDGGNNPNMIWNYYSQFFHDPDIVIDGLAYAYAYDDQGSFSSTIVAGVPGSVTPTGAEVHLGSKAEALTPAPDLPPLTEVLADSNTYTVVGSTGSPNQILSVKIFDAQGNLVDTVTPFNNPTALRVATGDFDGDGRDDEFAVLGRRTNSDLRAEIVTYDLDLDGNATETARFFAFEAGILGNGFIATGDFDSDGDDDIAVAQIGGGRTVVTLQLHVSNGGSFSMGGSIEIDFGLISAPRIAAGDTDGDSFDEIVIAARTPDGARVLVFDANDPGLTPEQQGAGFFWDFGIAGYSRGAFVAVGQFDPTLDGEEIVLGSNVGGGGQIDIVNYDQLGAAALVDNGRLTPFGAGYNAAVRVAVGDIGDRPILVAAHDRFQTGAVVFLARDFDGILDNPPFEFSDPFTALSEADGLGPNLSLTGLRTLGPFVGFASPGLVNLLAPAEIDLALAMFDKEREELVF